MPKQQQNSTIAKLVEMSADIGSDPRFIQGGGGNTSAKSRDNRYLYVKASGTALADMTKDQGFRRLSVKKLLAILDAPDLAGLPPAEREKHVLGRMLGACADERPGRPSTESCLHAMLGQYVIHTHPAVVNGFLCSHLGAKVLMDVLASKSIKCLLVDYSDPGFTLAREVRQKLDEYVAEHGYQPQVLLLQNHGMFVSADGPEAALELTREVFRLAQLKYCEVLGKAERVRIESREDRAAVSLCSAAIRRYLRENESHAPLLRFVRAREVDEFLALPERRALAATRPLVPDQIVYLRGAITWLTLPKNKAKAAQTLDRRLGKADPKSTVFIIDGVGMFVCGADIACLEANSAIALSTLETLMIACQFGGPQPLSSAQARFISEWEAEHFRRSLVEAGAESPKALEGMAVVVTGAGSGIGRGVSIGLAGEGAFVVLADIDEDAAEETADIIRRKTGARRALPLRTDVTSEDSVQTMVCRAVEQLGGVDILVNAAGIAPVHPLIEFPLADWKKTLDINLTGYFLVAREVVRRMVEQETGGSIVNISSKSGLSASKNHSGYNATKAAEIHLARGWALELAQYRIRVNVVCPGNVFRGSKIWNPDYIKALAAKRGLSPDEVIPYYINLSALKEEITWDDISDAVAFLCSDRASKITGQTLVVDAGQVFVR